MGSAYGTLRDTSVGMMAFAPPRPPTYEVKTGTFYTRIPLAGGTQFLALKVFTPTGRANMVASGELSVLLFAHGNADDLGSSQSQLQWYSDRMDMVTVSFDYPGYGHSSGAPSEAGVYQSVLAAYEYCVGHLNARHVVVVGKSLGSGAAAYLASHSDVVDAGVLCGVALISPLASGARVLSATRFLPESVLRRLDGEFMPVLEHMEKVTIPTCIVHGVNDTVVPVSNFYRLTRAVPSKHLHSAKLFPFRDHNDLESQSGEELITFLREFAYDVLLPASSGDI